MTGVSSWRSGIRGDDVEDDRSSDAEAILTMSEKLKESYMNRDLERFIDFFTDDVVCMPSDEQPVVGRAAWRSWLLEWWEEKTVNRMDLMTDEILVFGDWAFERHHETQVTSPRGGGEARQASFKGVWILRRDAGGSWKIARYVWNSSPTADEKAQA